MSGVVIIWGALQVLLFKYFTPLLTVLGLLKEECKLVFFYCCTVHYGIYILFTHQQMHFLLNLEKFKFT